MIQVIVKESAREICLNPFLFTAPLLDVDPVYAGPFQLLANRRAIILTRLFGFYIWKVIFPLVVLVIISWSVFWMIGDGLADRMSVSLTGILTIVAYQFIISEDLPRVSYFTYMDTILTLSFVLMAMTIFENVTVNVLYLQQKEELAHRIDHISRWAFPLVYFIGLIIFGVIFLG